MEKGINDIKTVEGYDNTLTKEIDVDYAKAKLEHNKKLELAEIEEAVEYLKTDLKLKLCSTFYNSYDYNFFNDLTSKHIELLALSFVKWFIEEPEDVKDELEYVILNDNVEDTSEDTLLNRLDLAINYEFSELSPDYYKYMSTKERQYLIKEL